MSEMPEVIGVIGAGTMGAGIAQLAAAAGARTLLHDPVPGARDRGLAQVADGLERWRAKGRLQREPGEVAAVAGIEALSEAAEQITLALAPGSVDVRLRGRDPEFTVSPGIEDGADLPAAPAVVPPESEDDGGTWRVTLRLPEHLRARVDAAARGDGLSVNAWLVRAVTAALGGANAKRPRGDSGKHFSGWVR